VSTIKVFSGICGFWTIINAEMDGEICRIKVESECEDIQKLSEEITEVEPFNEISFRGGEPIIYQLAKKHCPHASCPVPAAMIKAVEIAAGLALPANVVMEMSND